MSQITAPCSPEHLTIDGVCFSFLLFAACLCPDFAAKGMHVCMFIFFFFINLFLKRAVEDTHISRAAVFLQGLHPTRAFTPMERLQSESVQTSVSVVTSHTCSTCIQYTYIH